VQFEVLGPLQVRSRTGAVVPVPERKVRTLLAVLLAASGRPVGVDRLVEDLWGDDPPLRPAAVLRSKVSQLRRALGDGELVVHRPPGYLLRLGDGGATTDAQRFEALLGRARDVPDPRRRADLLGRALAGWRGPAFAEFADAGFARAVIARLEEQRLVAVEELAHARLALGEHAELAAELGELVRQHPFRERLLAAYLQALYRAGRGGEALAAYAALRRRLATEFGTDPGPEVAAVHQAILEQDPALDAPRSNLPVPLTPLIGRDEAVTAVVEALRTARLVTLTGTGGVGKTRLALAVAARPGRSFEDGVWLAEFGGLTGGEAGPDQVAEVVAAALGVREDSPRGPEVPPGGLAGRLLDSMRPAQLLLVLDNCEHVVEPVARLAHDLLAAAPGLRILATSQEPLGVAGETVWVVPPLELPEPAGDPEAVRQAAATRLFVARAAAASPGFAVNPGNAAAVTTVCRRLDGVPLALELAATAVRGLGVHQLAERLDDRFRLLAAGRRDGPARQRTLAAAIEWSWSLLPAAERALLRRLAVFAGGHRLDAAEAVCPDRDVPPGAVPALLARLVDRSLVQVDAGAPDGPRYRLLESVAAYARERLLESGEEDRLRAAHCHHYVDLAERADAGLRGSGQREWLRRLDAEEANLRAALETAEALGSPGLALRLVDAMGWYWYLRGRRSLALRSYDAALASPGGPAAERAAASVWRARFGGSTVDVDEAIPDPVRRARMRWFLGFVRIGFDDPPAVERAAEGVLEVFRRHGDPWGVAAALVTRAWSALARSDLPTATRDGERALAGFTELGDDWGRMQAMDVLAEVAQISGDLERASGLHRDGLQVAEDFALWTEVSYKLGQLGRIALLAGEHGRAAELHERAQRLASARSDRFGEQFAAVGLGLGARRQGRLDEAEAHLSGWLEWCRDVGWWPGVALINAELGFVAELRGDAATAAARHLDGLVAARRTGDPRALALAMEGLAGAAVLVDRPASAARLLGAAAAERASAGTPLPAAERGDVDRIRAAAVAALGESRVAEEAARCTRPGRVDADIAAVAALAQTGASSSAGTTSSAGTGGAPGAR
jgi:predicted ATPase/DNA-binding SARP family transcriptional activator